MLKFIGPLLFLLFCTFAILVSPSPVVDNQALSCRSKRDAGKNRRTLYGRHPHGAQFSQASASTSVSAANGHTVISLTVPNGLVEYNVIVRVGSRNYTLAVDTGSSNLWIQTHRYHESNSSVPTGNRISFSINGINITGFERLDTVTLGCGTVITNQSISVARSKTPVNGVDGVFGIGPTALTSVTRPDKPGQDIPTVTDNLFNQSIIPSRKLGLSFQPWFNKSFTLTGQIIWGDIDHSSIIGPVTYVPILKTPPSESFMVINASLKYGTQTFLEAGSGIIDSGTTQIFLATPLFEAYKNATGAKEITRGLLKGGLTISQENFAKLQPFVFTIGGTPFVLTPNAQRWQRALNTNFGYKPTDILLVFVKSRPMSGKGQDFTLGIKWMERFYVVYDPDSNQVGVANTSITLLNIN